MTSERLYIHVCVQTRRRQQTCSVLGLDPEWAASVLTAQLFSVYFLWRVWARLLKSLLLRAGVLQDGRIRPTNGGSLSRLALCAPTLVTTSQHFSGGVRFLSSAETQRHQNFKESTSLTDSTLTRKKKKTPHRPNRLNPADQSPGSVWHRGEERGNAASGPGSKQSSWAGSSYVALCLQLLDYEQDLWPLTCDEHITSSTYGRLWCHIDPVAMEMLWF